MSGETTNTVKRASEALIVASKEDDMSYCLVNGFVEQNPNMNIFSGSREVQIFVNDPEHMKVRSTKKRTAD